MLQNIGSTEIIIIAIVLIVLFGPKRIPEFMRSMGSSVKEFKKAINDDPEENKKDDSGSKNE